MKHHVNNRSVTLVRLPLEVDFCIRLNRNKERGRTREVRGRGTRGKDYLVNLVSGVVKFEIKISWVRF